MSDDLNPSNKDYERKFTNPTEMDSEGTDNQDTDTSKPAAGFSYTGDGTREALIGQENGETDDQATSQAEQDLYKPESQAKSGFLARFGQGEEMPLKSNSRKKMFIRAGGGGFALLIVGGALLLLFMAVSGFNVKHYAEVLRLGSYASLHTASYRRMGQYMVEKSLNPNAEGFKVTAQRRTLVDRFTKFNPNEVLANLRQEGSLEFIKKDGTKSSFFTRLTDNTSDLASIKIGDTIVETPRNSRWNTIANYRDERRFVKDIQSAVESSDLFAEKSRLFRTKTVNSILEASDIKLFRWTKRGRTVKTFKDGVMSIFDRVNEGKKNNKSSLNGMDEAAESFEESFPENLDKTGNVGSATEKGVVEAAEKAGGGKLKAAARTASVASLMATLYCSARDYINANEENAQAKIKTYKQYGAMTMSAGAQLESGDVTMTAVQQESKRLDGSNNSKTYSLIVGNEVPPGTPDDLEKSDSPVVHTDSNLYRFFDGIKRAVDATPAMLLIPDDQKTSGCNLVTSATGQIALLILENALSAVASAFSGGGATAAQQGGRVALTESFKQAARTMLSKEVLKQFASGVAKDAAFYFLTDLILKAVLNHSSNPAGDESATAFAKAHAGNTLIKNDIANGLGGKTLNSQETSELNDYLEKERLAALHKKPFLARLASLTDIYSPASRAVATLPYSPESFKSKSLAFAEKSLNPITILANNTSRVAGAALGSGKVYAAGNESLMEQMEKIGIPTVGWSVSELEKMLEPDYWPMANAKYIEEHESEFEQFKECFSPMTDTVEPKCGHDMLSTEAGFRYRLYQMDGGNASEGSGETDYNDGLLGSLLDAQEITADSGTSSPGALPGEISADSSDVPCAPNTRDLGIRDDAYSAGRRLKIRLCAITSIQGTSEESTGGVPNANGQALVSSIASDAWQRLGEAAQAAGIPLTAGSSWRTMAHQERLCAGDDKCPSGNYNDVARPGTSNHQAGVAIDIAQIYQATGGPASGRDCNNVQTANVPTYTWMAANARSYGLKQYANEAWHWGTAERC